MLFFFFYSVPRVKFWLWFPSFDLATCIMSKSVTKVIKPCHISALVLGVFVCFFKCNLKPLYCLKRVKEKTSSFQKAVIKSVDEFSLVTANVTSRWAFGFRRHFTVGTKHFCSFSKITQRVLRIHGLQCSFSPSQKYETFYEYLTWLLHKRLWLIYLNVLNPH